MEVIINNFRCHAQVSLQKSCGKSPTKHVSIGPFLLCALAPRGKSALIQPHVQYETRVCKLPHITASRFCCTVHCHVHHAVYDLRHLQHHSISLATACERSLVWAYIHTIRRGVVSYRILHEPLLPAASKNCMMSTACCLYPVTEHGTNDDVRLLRRHHYFFWLCLCTLFTPIVMEGAPRSLQHRHTWQLTDCLRLTEQRTASRFPLRWWGVINKLSTFSRLIVETISKFISTISSVFTISHTLPNPPPFWSFMCFVSP